MFIVSVSGDVALTKRTCRCACGGVAAVGPGSELVLLLGKLMDNIRVARERMFR